MGSDSLPFGENLYNCDSLPFVGHLPRTVGLDPPTYLLVFPSLYWVLKTSFLLVFRSFSSVIALNSCNLLCLWQEVSKGLPAPPSCHILRREAIHSDSLIGKSLHLISHFLHIIFYILHTYYIVYSSRVYIKSVSSVPQISENVTWICAVCVLNFFDL